MNIQLKKMTQDDVKVLSPIMKRAFDYDSFIHTKNKEGGPKGYDDGSFLIKYGLNSGADSFCILCDNVIIGSVICFIKENGHNYLGCIFIDVDYENKGIGSIVWKEIEKMYPSTKIWTVETPIFSKRNHNFYVNKCGFYVVKIENPKSEDDGFYIFKKFMDNRYSL